MSGVIPIPTTRVSNLLIRQRLTSQLQGDQLEIFRLQNQVSTGRRISLASEDAPSAQRAITLQRLIQRKAQLQTNVLTGQEFLTASDVALNDVASLLGDIRGQALGAASTTATDEERSVAASKVDQAIDQLLTIANRRYRGRYLFAGSQTNVEPYSRAGNSVQYAGDEKEIQNFSDIDVLFSTNAPGANVFGGISDQVVGGVDLNPQLSSSTLLSSLRGGRGISSNGALQISDGTSSRTIDISRAVSVGDVVRLIEENPPAGRQVTATVTAQGLTLQLDAPGGGNLTVTEVGSGHSASELGILNKTGTLTNPLVGSDLDPTILKTTRIEDLLGTRARTRIFSAGDNNDLLIEANANGTASTGVTIQFVDDAAAGAENATLAGTTLTVHIAAGQSTAGAVASTINAQGTFTASLDPTDSTNIALAGTGAVALASTGVTSGGSGTTLDIANGLAVQNGGNSYTIDLSQAETVEDILNSLNGSGAGLYAAINATGTGIDVRSRWSGRDFQIGENGGTTATQLGLRTYSRELRLDDLNFGTGVPTNNEKNLSITQSQLAITTRSGSVINVDLSAATTLTDVYNAITAATGSSVTVLAADGGTALRLVDNTIGSAPLSVVQTGTTLPITGGVTTHVQAPDFWITTRNGQGFNVDVSSATTVGDVIDAINAASGGTATATLATTGNGIQLVDNTVGAGQLTVNKVENSLAAQALGFIPEGSTQATSASGTLVGADTNLTETSSVFTTLLRLRDALLSNDIEEISRATALIDDDINRSTSARADVGAREQALDIAHQNLQDEDVQLKSALSNEIDVDLVEAISNLTARPVSLQASLQSIGSILQLSLLDYI